MGIRHIARQRALQLLYALEFAGGEAPEEVERRFLAADKLHRRGWGPFARSLARQTWEHRAKLDDAIRPTLKHWTLERLPIMDRICLRAALCELVYFPDIPLRVTINESIELARLFGNDEAPVYINAVLDTLAKAFPSKDFKAGEGMLPPKAPAGPAQSAFDPGEGSAEALSEAESPDDSSDETGVDEIDERLGFDPNATIPDAISYDI